MAEEETGQTLAPSEEAAPAAPEPQAAPSEPFDGAQDKPTATPEAEAQTAQIPANEPFDETHDKPITPEPEPFEAVRDKPTPPPASAPETHRDSSPAPSPASAGRTDSTSSPQGGRDLLVKARATIQQRKQKKLEKILEFLNAKGKVTNDEVEKLLHVSDATATRYLSALEKEGKIKQVGKTGKAVVYKRI